MRKAAYILWRVATFPFRLMMEFLADFVWGAGNPIVDNYATDWSLPLRRNTGDPVHTVAQSHADFLKSVEDEYLRRFGEHDHSQAAEDAFPVAAAGRR